MADGDNSIAALLRQKQILDQLNQTTSQGAQAAMLGGGANLRAFDDTGGGTQTTSTGVAPVQKGGGIVRGLGGAANPLNEIDKAKANLVQKGVQNIKNVFQGSGEPKPGFIPPPVTNPPTLVNRTPTNQPNLPPGYQIQMDDSGNITAVPHNPQPQVPGQAYSPFNQVRNQGLYTPGQLVGQ